MGILSDMGILQQMMIAAYRKAARDTQSVTRTHVQTYLKSPKHFLGSCS
jgi:hypothetical protein